MHLPDLEFRMRANSPSVTQFVRELPWHSVFSAFHWLPFLCSLLSASALSLSLHWLAGATSRYSAASAEAARANTARMGPRRLDQFEAI